MCAFWMYVCSALTVIDCSVLHGMLSPPWNAQSSMECSVLHGMLSPPWKTRGKTWHARLTPSMPSHVYVEHIFFLCEIPWYHSSTLIPRIAWSTHSVNVKIHIVHDSTYMPVKYLYLECVRSTCMCAVMLSCCHAVMLSCCHAVMLSCCHAVMLSCCHAVMLSCCHAVMLSCCHAVIGKDLSEQNTEKNILNMKHARHMYVYVYVCVFNMDVYYFCCISELNVPSLMTYIGTCMHVCRYLGLEMYACMQIWVPLNIYMYVWVYADMGALMPWHTYMYACMQMRVAEDHGKTTLQHAYVSWCVTWGTPAPGGTLSTSHVTEIWSSTCWLPHVCAKYWNVVMYRLLRCVSLCVRTTCGGCITADTGGAACLAQRSMPACTRERTMHLQSTRAAHAGVGTCVPQ